MEAFLRYWTFVKWIQPLDSLRVTRNFDVLFDVRLNDRLSKQ